jgi:hypothetical protein
MSLFLIILLNYSMTTSRDHSFIIAEEIEETEEVNPLDPNLFDDDDGDDSFLLDDDEEGEDEEEEDEY